jgi:hypothetical protein
MEGVVLLGLLGAGYLANEKESKLPTGGEYQPPSVGYGSGTSVYDLNHERDAKARERQMVQEFRDLSKVKGSSVIDAVNPNQANHFNQSKSDMVESASGTPISKDDFLVNDQGIKVEPFFSGAGPANINFEENRALIDHQGGPQAFRSPKKEIGQLFPLEKTYGNVFGNQFEGPNSDQSRFIPGTKRTNELPFQQEKTAPIDSRSNLNRDVGMIHAERNTTENRRTLNNQKENYGGVILGGEGIHKREEQGEIFKHLPNQDYLQTADRWLVTTGATNAHLIRPENVMPETNRQYFNKGEFGVAGSSAFGMTESRPMVKRSTNQQLRSDTARNATMEGKAVDDDHDVTSFFVYPNERETTVDNYFVDNPTPVHQAETTRVQDIVRPTVKETTHFSYTGDGASLVPAELASDKYQRADLNMNKEWIAQGRSPTPQSVKLSNGMDTVNMSVDKIDRDYMNHHISNMDRIYQEIPQDNTCQLTSERTPLNNKRLSDRLDPQNLDPFRENPFTHSLSSFYGN